MPESGTTIVACPSCTAREARDRDAVIYDRHATGLYRQALLTLGNTELAEQVVCDVITSACVGAPASAGEDGDADYRLAVLAYRRCQELVGGSGWRAGVPAPQPPESLAGCIDPGGLSSQERGALGLVLFGGLGYVQASREAAITPDGMAALLRAVLRKLAAPAPDPAHEVPTRQRPSGS
ncbi:MAG: hypothetical protein ABSA93_14125 [Streptosporangiaceae bacterium]|jgi:hypothetical protein